MKIEIILNKINLNRLFLDSEKKESLLITSFILSNLEMNGTCINEQFHDLFTKELTSLSLLTIANITKKFPEEINGREIGIIIKKLSDIEEKEGGPYLNKQGKAEIYFNIIISYLLSSLETEIASLDEYIENNFLSGKLETTRIKKSLAIYLLSQTYKGDKNKFIESIFNNETKDILDEILLALSLLNIGYKDNISSTINTIKNRSKELEHSFVFIDDIKTTPELNFSFYYALVNKYETMQSIEKNENAEKEIIKSIIKRAEKEFEGLSEEFSKLCLEQIQKTINKNQDKQMSLMAYYTANSLDDRVSISEENIIELGLMNTFFWTAFIIYDDFWDEDEEADPRILPSANIFARKYSSCFTRIFKDNMAFFNKIMDNLDMANSWEVSHCRVPIINNSFIIPSIIPDYKDYSYKFYPSSGHILGPIAVMANAGYDPTSKTIEDFENYFKNYLIAMQINDDAHDWEEDIKRGHISTVVAMILERWKEKYPKINSIHLEKDIEKIQEIFWFDVLPRSAQLVLSFTEKSKKALHQIEKFKNYQYLEKFININEQIARKSLLEQRRSIEMLEQF